MKGEKGDNGTNGTNGVDGKNAVANVTDNGNGTHTITITDGDGKQTTTIVKDGKDGSADGYLLFEGDSGKQSKRTSSEKVTVSGGQTDTSKLVDKPNIGVVSDGEGKLSVKLSKDVDLTKKGSMTVGNTTINSNGVTINNGPSITSSGIDAGSKRITNVAPGVADSDAVNVSQLKGVQNNINYINHKVDKLDRRVRGIGASSAAAAALPQVYIPGKSMIAASAGGYDGASAVALGYSRASDNGKVILKLQGTANSQGHISGGVGVGYQW